MVVGFAGPLDVNMCETVNCTQRITHMLNWGKLQLAVRPMPLPSTCVEREASAA